MEHHEVPDIGADREVWQGLEQQCPESCAQVISQREGLTVGTRHDWGSKPGLWALLLCLCFW